MIKNYKLYQMPMSLFDLYYKLFKLYMGNKCYDDSKFENNILISS